MDNKEEKKDTKEDVKKEEQKNKNEKNKEDKTKKEITNNKKKKDDNKEIVEAKKPKDKKDNNTKKNENLEKEMTNPKANVDSKKLEEKNEKVENKTDATDLIKSEDIEIDEKKLSKINEEIKENKKKSRNNKIKNGKYVRILRNVVIAVVGIAYISIALMGSKRIPEKQYQLDLKVFIILGVIVAILLFEKAFKSDKFRFALVGIEVLVLSGATIMLLHLYRLQDSNILKYSKYFLLVWSVYYILKNIIIAIKRTDINKKEDENN